MNLRLIVIISAVAIKLIFVAILLFILHFSSSKNYVPGGVYLHYKSYGFTFTKEASVEESSFSDKPILKRDGMVVWWQELPGYIDIHEFEDRHNTTVPDIDMERFSIIVSFGRKIEKLRYFSSERYSNNNDVAIVTFSEGFYENTLFFYMIERDRRGQRFVFVPSGLDSPCFIMDGEDELYLGLNLRFLSEP